MMIHRYFKCIGFPWEMIHSCRPKLINNQEVGRRLVYLRVTTQPVRSFAMRSSLTATLGRNMAVALQSIGDLRSGDADDRSLTSKPLVQDSILISRCRMLVWPRLNMAVSLSLNDCLAVDLPYRPKIKCISHKWLLKNLSYAHKLTGTKTPLSREKPLMLILPKKNKTQKLNSTQKSLTQAK